MSVTNPNLVPLLFTSKQAAALLQISERNLWSLAQRGDIRSVRFGRSVRFDARDLDQFIQSHKDGGQ
jgi:excisionase family DNA binding protein